MTTFFLYDDALRSREVRHEIGEPIADPIGFIEADGRRIVVGSILEAPIPKAREDVLDEFWTMDELGYEELVANEDFPEELIGSELMLRALERVGSKSVTVPPSLGVLVADYLRDRGIEVLVDNEAWTERRRRKSPWEIEGIERAQRAAETAMLAAAHVLREAEPTADGHLRFDGEVLTAEIIREAMSAELLSQGAESEEIIVHSGDACLRGHDPGSGPILPDASCIIDCFPRDRRTGVYSDMTRTFVPGKPSRELKRLHDDCRAALDIAFEHLVPGRDDAYRHVAEFLSERGHPTRLHHEGPGPLERGFFHALGHGVGLDVHEPPWMGRRSDPIVVGDVVAVEPGLYFDGIGGVRLEDTVLITESGVEHISEPFPYGLEP